MGRGEKADNGYEFRSGKGEQKRKTVFVTVHSSLLNR